jgi:ribulose-phosphate 3-epimerase
MVTGGELLQRLLRDGPRLSVGMLTANLLELGRAMQLLADAGIELVHIDVMDGVFCPGITVGAPVVRAMPALPLKDAHLMIDDPLTKVEAFVQAGANIITFHLEGARQPYRVLQALAAMTNANDGDREIIRGVGLNPSTPVEAIEPLLDELEYVLVLGINPGWSGQAFLPGTEHRLARMRELIDASGRRILLGVDGGVTRGNIDTIAALGTDIIVSGSAIFDGGDVPRNLAAMRRAIQSVRRTSGPAPSVAPAGMASG